MTNEGKIYFCNKTQNTPKLITETKILFSKLEFHYCCDSENMFYKLNGGELEKKGEFESFIELFAKDLKRTSKMIHIRDESEKSDKRE